MMFGTDEKTKGKKEGEKNESVEKGKHKKKRKRIKEWTHSSGITVFGGLRPAHRIQQPSEKSMRGKQRKTRKQKEGDREVTKG